MKVCIIANLAELSGSNKSLVDLCRAFKTIDIDIVVLVPRKGLLSEELKKYDIQFKILYYATWIEYREKKLKRFLKIAVNAIAGIRFLVFCKKRKIDIVHYNSISVGIGSKWLRRYGVSYIWHIREYINRDEIVFHFPSSSLKMISQSDRLIAISESVMERYNNVFQSGKWSLIANGIPIDTVCAKISRNIKDLNKFIIVGGIEENKGQLEAVQAFGYFAKRYDAMLYIVGPVNNRKYYQKIVDYANKNNIIGNIVFTGFVHDVSQVRKKCGIALICSRYEAFGRVTVEAMLYREIVIGANSGGTREIIENGVTGLLYEVGNVDSLISAINEIMEHPGDFFYLLENAYNKVISEYAINTTASKVKKVYEEVLSSKEKNR